MTTPSAPPVEPRTIAASPRVQDSQPDKVNRIDARTPEIEFFGLWNHGRQTWDAAPVLRPILYDHAITATANGLEPPKEDDNRRAHRLKTGQDRDDDDFVNRDTRRFWVRIKDVKGLGTIAMKWETFDESGNRTSFEGSEVRSQDESTVYLWEEKAADDKHSYYYSPWLGLTTTRWDVHRVDTPWVYTSPGFPKARLYAGAKANIRAGEPGFRLRRCVPLGTCVVTYLGAKGTRPIFHPDEVRALAVCVVVLRKSSSEADDALARRIARWILETDFDKVICILSRIGIVPFTSGLGPPGSVRIDHAGRVAHILDTPLVSAPNAKDNDWVKHPKEAGPRLHFYNTDADWNALSGRLLPPGEAPKTIRMVCVHAICNDAGNLMDGYYASPPRDCLVTRPPTSVVIGSAGLQSFNAHQQTSIVHEIGHALTPTYRNPHTAGHYQQPDAPSGGYRDGEFVPFEIQHLMKHTGSCMEKCTSGRSNGDCVKGHARNGSYYGSVFSLDTIFDMPDGSPAKFNWYERMRDPANGYVRSGRPPR